jgi:carboxylesterase
MARQRASESAIVKGAETIDLQEGDSHGVLLLHGFGDTPQTLSLLARRLAKSGYGVFAPLLPGHGRSVEAFQRSRADEWIAAARDALRAMHERYEIVSVVGLSMGGALAVVISAESASIASLTLVAPYLGMPTRLRLAAALHWLWGPLAGQVNSRSPRSIRDPIEREKNLAYGRVTGRSLFELWRVVLRGRKALSRLKAPTLIIMSNDDPRVAVGVGRSALKQIGVSDKKLIVTEGAGHIITVDYGRERVFAEIETWLRAHGGRGATAAENYRAAVDRLSARSDPGRIQ